jgi:hypothetical protein
MLARALGSAAAIAQLRRRDSAYRSSFALEEIELLLDDGTTLELMFKDLSARALLPEARQAKPAFLVDPAREVEVYNKVLSGQGLGTARCYGCVIEPHRERYWLFLEKVRGVELYQVGDFTVWQEVARWLARMHGRMEAVISESPVFVQARLVRYDGDFYLRWVHRALAFSERSDKSDGSDGSDKSDLSDRLHRSDQPKARQRLCRLADRYQRVIDKLLALPTTFIHGEFYASNILVEQRAALPRVCPIDWETAGIGPGLVDLAALSMGKWSKEQQRRLASAYHSELCQIGGGPQNFDEFLQCLKFCRLHLAVQWLGWSPAWSPPAEHAQDWLAEALQTAEELHL